MFYDNTEDVTITYEMGSVTGNLMYDKFCFTNFSTCLDEDLLFLGVEKSTNMDSFEASGFIGLAPRSPYADSKEFPSFITQITSNFTNPDI